MSSESDLSSQSLSLHPGQWYGRAYAIAGLLVVLLMVATLATTVGSVKIPFLTSQYGERLTLIDNGWVRVQGSPSEVITPQNIKKEVYGTENCVYNHPFNGLPTVLIKVGNSQAADLRKAMERNVS